MVGPISEADIPVAEEIERRDTTPKKGGGPDRRKDRIDRRTGIERRQKTAAQAGYTGPERRSGEEAHAGGIGFGLLVHRLLEAAPFGASRAVLDALASVDARVLGLTDQEASAAVAAVERLLSHDLLVRAAAADARGACRRETPVTRTAP